MTVQEDTEAEAVPDSAGIDPGVVKVIWATLIGGLAVLFGTTIVAVALDPLATELNTSVETIQWVSTAYLLALAVTVPVVGWAQRRLGGKRLWITGLVIFLAASLLCAIAWNPGSLIAFRALQGIGGGILMPLMGTLVVQAAGGKDVARIMSIVSLPAVLGPILGPVIGGLILDWLSWHWLFIVNVPFCVVGLILAVRLLPKDGPTSRPSFDAVGFGMISLALVGVLFALSNSGKSGGFARTDVYLPLIAGAILLVVFAFWGMRRGPRAIFDVRLLKHWPLASSSLLLFLSGFALYGAMLLLPLYFQQVRGFTPLVAGMLLIPQGIGTLVARIFAGRLDSVIGSRWLTVIGFAILTLGTAPFIVADTDTNLIAIWLILFVRGIGLGAVTIPLMALAYRGLENDEVPDASLISRISQQLGGSFGSAVLAVILGMAVSQLPDGLDPSGAFGTAFLWATCFAAGAVALSFLLPGRERPVATRIEA